MSSSLSGVGNEVVNSTWYTATSRQMADRRRKHCSKGWETLVISDIVYAELSIHFETQREAATHLSAVMRSVCRPSARSSFRCKPRVASRIGSREGSEPGSWRIFGSRALAQKQVDASAFAVTGASTVNCLPSLDLHDPAAVDKLDREISTAQSLLRFANPARPGVQNCVKKRFWLLR